MANVYTKSPCEQGFHPLLKEPLHNLIVQDIVKDVQRHVQDVLMLKTEKCHTSPIARR